MLTKEWKPEDALGLRNVGLGKSVPDGDDTFRGDNAVLALCEDAGYL